jgi:hypothetical protein
MKKIIAFILSLVVSIMFVIPAFAGTVSSNEYVDPMPHVIEEDNTVDNYVTVIKGKYTIVYNTKNVTKINKATCDIDNTDLLLTVTHKNGTVYTGSDVIVKCKETSKGLKVIIKKVGTKKVNKSFIIPNEISNDCVLTR